MYPKRTPYNYVSIRNIRGSLNYFRQKITKKECGGTKECFDLIFIHTFVCGKRKEKLKIKANAECLNGEGLNIFNFVYTLFV